MTNKQDSQSADERDEMLPEYDLSKRTGQRGKYYESLQQGYTVRIHEEDGTTTVRYYQVEKGAVLLDPDVRQYFPDAKAVNSALRSLIALIPEQQPGRRRKSRVTVEKTTSVDQIMP